MKDEKAVCVLKSCVALFFAVFSIVVLAKKIPETRFVMESVESIESSKESVMGLTGATLATSLAISALPDDFASPIAETLSDLNKYSVLILAALLVERLIVVIGTKIAFMYVIPIACAIYTMGVWLKKIGLKNFAFKMGILGLMLILVIPFSTHFIDSVGGEYLQYVSNTIDETNEGAGKINEILAQGETGETLTEKLSGLVNMAIKGVNELIAYFENGVKKCITSLAIIIVCTCVMPIVTLLLFKWLLKELFSIKFPKEGLKSLIPTKKKKTE